MGSEMCIRERAGTGDDDVGSKGSKRTERASPVYTPSSGSLSGTRRVRPKLTQDSSSVFPKPVPQVVPKAEDVFPAPARRPARQ